MSNINYNTAKMPTIIHLIRHAQGYHNVNHDVSIPDPYLTPLGLQQSQQLGASFPAKDKITHIVASPMKRTLNTAYYAFQDLIDTAAATGGGDGDNNSSKKKIIANPLLQEVNEYPCDVGSEPEALVPEFGAHVDLALVVKGWNVKTPGSMYAADDASLERRARAARTWLRKLGRSQDNAVIVVVSHGDFIKYLTQTNSGASRDQWVLWANAECHTYEFVDPEGDDGDASIREVV
ncbi:hypothetical protein N0V82_005946 [Gnomoniopsis sp. IMI 355080]|nr:hypothetical protein N0V82_005946 [Gnomoniopsis sp. IMI 355080]